MASDPCYTRALGGQYSVPLEKQTHHHGPRTGDEPGDIKEEDQDGGVKEERLDQRRRAQDSAKTTDALRAVRYIVFAFRVVVDDVWIAFRVSSG